MVSLERYVAVDDFGTLVNPMLVEGQVHGGVAQGIGQALYEHTVYDGSGQLLSGSFMDYALPRADDLPSFELGFRIEPAKTNELGAKGCGEAGITAAPPTIMSAVIDALKPLGITHMDMPATPRAGVGGDPGRQSPERRHRVPRAVVALDEPGAQPAQHLLLDRLVRWLAPEIAHLARILLARSNSWP